MTKPMPAINCTQPSPEGFNFLVLIYTSFYKKLVPLYHGFYRTVIYSSPFFNSILINYLSIFYNKPIYSIFSITTS